jgi:hypothetical protein
LPIYWLPLFNRKDCAYSALQLQHVHLASLGSFGVERYVRFPPKADTIDKP